MVVYYYSYSKYLADICNANVYMYYIGYAQIAYYAAGIFICQWPGYGMLMSRLQLICALLILELLYVELTVNNQFLSVMWEFNMHQLTGMHHYTCILYTSIRLLSMTRHKRTQEPRRRHC